MKIFYMDQNSEEWLEKRKRVLTGSKLNNIYSVRGGYKVGYYELLAEHLAVDPDERDARERGHDLEPDAIAAFEAETGIKARRDVGFITSDDGRLGCSPDAVVGDPISAVVEAKCLGDTKHIKAFLTGKVPSEYWPQVLKYFIVIPDLQTVHFILYTDRIPSMRFKHIPIHRADYAQEIADMTDYANKILADVEAVVEEYAF